MACKEIRGHKVCRWEHMKERNRGCNSEQGICIEGDLCNRAGVCTKFRKVEYREKRLFSGAHRLRMDGPQRMKSSKPSWKQWLTSSWVMSLWHWRSEPLKDSLTISWQEKKQQFYRQILVCKGTVVKKQRNQRNRVL